jgi:methionine synthase II (cobalamin-independent)
LSNGEESSRADQFPDFCSQKFRDGWAEDKDNIGTVDDLLDAYIGLYNDVLSQIPKDMHTGIHLCRGNFSKPPASQILAFVVC